MEGFRFGHHGARRCRERAYAVVKMPARRSVDSGRVSNAFAQWRQGNRENVEVIVEDHPELLAADAFLQVAGSAMTRTFSGWVVHAQRLLLFPAARVAAAIAAHAAFRRSHPGKCCRPAPARIFLSCGKPRRWRAACVAEQL